MSVTARRGDRPPGRSYPANQSLLRALASSDHSPIYPRSSRRDPDPQRTRHPTTSTDSYGWGGSRCALWPGRLPRSANRIWRPLHFSARSTHLFWKRSFPGGRKLALSAFAHLRYHGGLFLNEFSRVPARGDRDLHGAARGRRSSWLASWGRRSSGRSRVSRLCSQGRSCQDGHHDVPHPCHIPSAIRAPTGTTGKHVKGPDLPLRRSRRQSA